MTVSEFIKQMTHCGVRFSILDDKRVRALTHWMVSEADVDEALKRVGSFLKYAK